MSINWEFYKNQKTKLKMSDGLSEALRGTYFQNKKPMKKFLYFSADWCGPCRQLGPVMEEINNSGYPVQKINIDNNPELAQKFGIRNIPTVILTIDDRDVARKVGSNPKQVYLDMYNQN